MCFGPFIRHIFDLDGSVQIPYRRESRGVGLDRVVLGWFVVVEGGGVAEAGGLSSKVSFLVVKRRFLKTLLVIRGFVWTSIRGDKLTLNKINTRTVSIMAFKITSPHLSWPKIKGLY